MRPKHSGQPKASAERVVKDIRRATRRHFSAEDKIRIVLEGLRGDDSIAELCRKEGIAQSLYYLIVQPMQKSRQSPDKDARLFLVCAWECRIKKGRLKEHK